MAEYIERDAVLSDLEAAEKHGGMGTIIANTLKRYVKRVPSSDVAPVVHAKWDDSLDGITPFCTACGCTHRCLIRTPLYCPNCGAKMDLKDLEG